MHDAPLSPTRAGAVAYTLVLACSPLGAASASAQTPDGFTSLFDGQTLTGWVVENSDGANFTVVDGALRVAEPVGWLRTEEVFTDYELLLEFRLLTDGADSGIFNRAAADEEFARGWPNESYQVQLRDMHQPSRFLPLGHVYRHGMPQGDTQHDGDLLSSLYGGVGEWHELRIEVVGPVLTVELEGHPITRAENVVAASGHIGFQGEAGTVEYRSIRVRRLD